MIEFRTVDYIYPNGVRALSSFTAVIPDHEFVFLAGPTGSGKSSALKMIYRELAPTRGEVWVNGLNVGKLRSSKVPMLRRTIGVVFEDFKLLNGRSVCDNVAYALMVVGAGESEVKRRVSKVLELVNLSHKANQNVENISRGEQQRTAIARAIVNGSGILIADEPTGHLDAEASFEIMQIFDRINKDGATVVVATHDLHWLEHLNRRVIFMYEGSAVEKLTKGNGHGSSNPPIFSS